MSCKGGLLGCLKTEPDFFPEFNALLTLSHQIWFRGPSADTVLFIEWDLRCLHALRAKPGTFNTGGIFSHNVTSVDAVLIH